MLLSKKNFLYDCDKKILTLNGLTLGGCKFNCIQMDIEEAPQDTKSS